MKLVAFCKKMNNEKGVAAVLVLAVILVLTALGTIALVASAANVSMSSKSRNWSADYYNMDSQAESYVKQVDDCLKSAETAAQEYVLNQYYTYPATSAAFTLKVVPLGFDPIIDATSQTFFNKYYDLSWTTGGAIITIQDYIDEPLVYTGSDLDPEQAKQEYQNELKEFKSGMFDRVYFFLAAKKLEALVSSIGGAAPEVPVVLQGGSAAFGIPSSTGTWTQKFTQQLPLAAATLNQANKDSVWSGFQPQTDDNGIYILIKNSNAVDHKSVQVEMKIPIPEYETVIQKINVPYKGNPIWANAISAQGEIKVTNSASVTIKGDVYTSGSGINITTSAALNVFGNVYSAGDVHVTGDGGDIHVFSYNTGAGNGADYAVKKEIYSDSVDNRLLFDSSLTGYMSSNGDDIRNYLEGSTSPAAIVPMVFPDGGNWGNVYCRNLSVDSGVNGAGINADGNVWTSDDIQMDGSGSQITVGTSTPTYGNYIGLNSRSDRTDPNASSSVINNKPENDGITPPSSITINGSFIVPGVAFYKFDDGPDHAFPYYRSAESVTAKATSPAAIFDAYVYEPPADPAAAEPNLEYEQGGGTILLYDWDPALKLEKLLNYMGGFGSGIKTNIFHGATVRGFSEGAAFMQADPLSPVEKYAKNGITGAAIIAGYSENSKAYRDLTNPYIDNGTSHTNDGVLMDIFRSKTSCLGTKNWNWKFGDYVSKPYTGPSAGMIYYSGDTTLNISTIGSGIIYCTGNLTITGTGTFKGSIICEKNVTISGGVTIEYNDSIISDKLEDYVQVRKFFEPGGMGAEKYAAEYSATSGTRTQLKRYKIIKWMEKQE